MAGWKRQKKQEFTARFLRFSENEVKEITVSNWDFTGGGSGYLFRCYVIKENGKETDKIWTVWDYDSAELLKKKLGTKSSVDSKSLKVRMHKNSEDDECFELL